MKIQFPNYRNSHNKMNENWLLAIKHQNSKEVAPFFLRSYKMLIKIWAKKGIEAAIWEDQDNIFDFWSLKIKIWEK